MTVETLKEAQKINSTINALKTFKSELLDFMQDDIITVPLEDHVHKGQLLWWKVLHKLPFNKLKDVDEAPLLRVQISDEDGREIYEDLCDVADKWIYILNKRMEEL